MLDLLGSPKLLRPDHLAVIQTRSLLLLLLLFYFRHVNELFAQSSSPMTHLENGSSLLWTQASGNAVNSKSMVHSPWSIASDQHNISKLFWSSRLDNSLYSFYSLSTPSLLPLLQERVGVRRGEYRIRTDDPLLAKQVL